MAHLNRGRFSASSTFYAQPSHRGFASLDSAYRDLGLSAGASLDEVKNAYRRLALQCHPDLHREGSEKFMRITAAYERILGRDRQTFRSPSYPSPGPFVYPAYPSRTRFDGRAATVWGLGLALGCVLFGSILFWSRVEMYKDGYLPKGSRRVTEPSRDVNKRERIASLLLEKARDGKGRGG